MRDKYVQECPFCNGTEMVTGCQQGYASVTSTHSIWSVGKKLNHVFCRNCGSLVRSYVDDPEKFVPINERRTRKREDVTPRKRHKI
ncbi:MAG: hypothetical protein K6G26_00615 [Lachnospiraceae bacterium]|nr:hypothetical protein [Lachnospiraceae bacterium]